MILTGYALAGLLAAGILFIGSRFLWAPVVAARDFGIADPPPPSTGFVAWLGVKGVRDMVSGLAVILLMANGAPRLLGEFLLIASLTACGDTLSVLRSGGSRAVAFGVHGATAVVIVVAGLLLVLGR